MKSYIEFQERIQDPKRKTKTFAVVPKGWGGREAEVLGEVRWFSRWRCYSFFPSCATIYEQVCLRHIALFCETETNRHRIARNRLDGPAH